MERRFLLAVSLMIAVLVVPSFFLKRTPPRRPSADTVRVDSSLARRDSAAISHQPSATTPVATVAPAPAAATFDTLWLYDSTRNRQASYRFTTAGASIDRAEFPGIRSFHDRSHVVAAQLVRPGDRLLTHRVITGADTISLENTPFTATRTANGITFTGRSGAVSQTVRVTMVPGRYVLDVSGEITGLQRGGVLLIGLGNGFANVEADSMDNYRNYGVAVRRGTPENINFRSVDPGVTRTVDGPLDWVAVKSKYFMGALLSPDSLHPSIGGALLVGKPREGRGLATAMQTTATMPVGPDGHFHYQLYLGPQLHQTIGPLGRDLDRASPYGGIIKGIIMPVAGLFTRLFIWMHESLHLSYGIALVVFGVMVRLVLWPLNQKAMKSQVAMMAIQPIVKDLQARYKNDPQKQQQEIMRVYKEHGVNPLGGCLPMLLPLPVLFALFFVFSRAIELRGTPFLWLPDLSLKDPLLITPIVMAASMFALSKLSQAGMPPNPQAKMMTYMMPAMMFIFFMNFSSGVNLYYAVSNLVSLPQQYLINKSRQSEMTRRQVVGTRT